MAAQGPEDHYYYPQGHGRPAFFETAGWGFRDPFDLFAVRSGISSGAGWEDEEGRAHLISPMFMHLSGDVWRLHARR